MSAKNSIALRYRRSSIDRPIIGTDTISSESTCRRRRQKIGVKRSTRKDTRPRRREGIEVSERRAKPEDMQLVIPIEDSSSGSKKCNHCIGRQQDEIEVDDRTASGAMDKNTGNEAILSAELRDQFENMKSIWRQARRGEDDEGSFSLNDNSEKRERRVRIREDLKRKEREIAVKTAIQVQNEIATWQSGIADLEALLAAEEEDEPNNEIGEMEEEGDNGPPGIREIAFVRRNINVPRQHLPRIQFPSLPPAILTEDDAEEEEDLVTMSTATSSRV